jgi:nicotinamide-nucleotide amidase
MKVSIITVGDEILAGRVVDIHGAYLSARLVPFGIPVLSIRSVGDAPGALHQALLEEAARSDTIVVAGGLGPTEDDRTRAECAAAAGVELEWREDWWERISAHLARRGSAPSPRNRRQAWFPLGSVPIENPYGSAPAFRMRLGPAEVWALPGVPEEFRGLVEGALLPTLRPGAAVGEGVWTFHGIPEAALDEWLVSTLTERGLPPTHHICVKEGEIEVRLGAGLDLAPLARARFAGRFLGAGAASLPERVVAEARAQGFRLAVAESCTGGRIAGRLTDTPGSSAVFEAGWVAYGNAAKVRDLGVPPELIAAGGAVSGPVAEAMARGARERAGVAVALSTTGIAGPGGGSEGKPVGTVWFGIATEGAVRSGVRHFRGDRERVRQLAVAQGLAILLATLRGEDPLPWATTGS